MTTSFVKKLLAAACMLVLCLMVSTGCVQKDYINNTSDGAIDPGASSGLHDGTYTVTSKYYDTYGYAQKFTMEVHSGIITKVQFAETSAAGTLRTAIDATWRQNITDSDNYKDLGDIYQVLTTSLIKKQQSDGIDTVSGATRTCESFKTLAATAISNSKKDEHATPKLDLDQTYQAEIPSPSDPSLILKLSVTYKGGVISDMSYDETKDGNARSLTLANKQLYSSFTKKTMENQSLATLPMDPANADEITNYNAALSAVASQRALY